MMTKTDYELIYDSAVLEHMRAIDRKYHSLIRHTIEEQLRHMPGIPTRNRKPLRRPIVPESEWELRFGPQNRFRVFYRIHESDREVHILAIGVKRRSELYIGKERFNL